MGFRGPPPTPTADLAARGSWRAKIRDDSKIKSSIPTVPGYLTADGKKLWKGYIKLLKPRGILTVQDATALAVLVETELVYRSVTETILAGNLDKHLLKVQKDTRSTLIALLKEFGCTPARRSSVPMTDTNTEKQSELDDLL